MKKIISLVLTACMVFALVPTISFAYDTTTDQDESYVQEDADFVGTSDTDEEEIYDPDTAVTEPQKDVLDLEPAADGDGWQKDPATGGWIYKYLGEPVKGKQMLGLGYYYFDDVTGILKVGWINATDPATQEAVKYYGNDAGTPDPSAPGSTYGVLKVGFYTDANTDKRYYFEPAGQCPGKMHTGWLKINSDKYYFKSTGVMQTGWLTLNKHKYYLNPKSGKNYGKMVTGYQKIKSDHYYFDTSNGKMKSNTAIKISGSLYYFYSSGKAVKKKGWFKGSDKGKRYCTSTGGKVATGTKKISGIYYQFSTSTGICTKVLGDTYDRQAQSKSSSTKYLIQVIKSKAQVRVYYGSKNNWNKKYTFKCAYNSSATSTGTFKVNGKTKRSANFQDKGKTCHWNYGTNYASNNQGFNGYIYDQNGAAVDTRLGGAYSLKRVRLSDNNALWIYNNIGTGTKVWVH